MSTPRGAKAFKAAPVLDSDRQHAHEPCPGCGNPIGEARYPIDTGRETIMVCATCSAAEDGANSENSEQTLTPGNVLPNGWTILAYRPDPFEGHLGTVLAVGTFRDYHPFATWTYNWAMPYGPTGGGTYFETLAEAAAAYGLEVHHG